MSGGGDGLSRFGVLGDAFGDRLVGVFVGDLFDPLLGVLFGLCEFFLFSFCTLFSLSRSLLTFFSGDLSFFFSVVSSLGFFFFGFPGFSPARTRLTASDVSTYEKEVKNVSTCRDKKNWGLYSI